MRYQFVVRPTPAPIGTDPSFQLVFMNPRDQNSEVYVYETFQHPELRSMEMKAKVLNLILVSELPEQFPV
jgi:hypothetical protein